MIIKINYLATALLTIFVWGGTEVGMAKQSKKTLRHTVEDHKKSPGVYETNQNNLQGVQDAEQSSKKKPGTWNISRSNAKRALSEVTKGIYQIHGDGFPNITIIEGREGIMIIAPFVPEEIINESLDLYYRKAGKRTVKAIVDTHFHIDHFANAKRVTSGQDINSRGTQILVQENSPQKVIPEKAHAGNAMKKDPACMDATPFDKTVKRARDSGKTITAFPPAGTATNTGGTVRIDGIEVEFMTVPGMGASPATLMYFPQFKALFYGEDTARAMHDICILGVSKIRDAKKRWKALDQVIQRYEDKIEILFAQHYRPRMGKENIKRFLDGECRSCKYMHDRILNLVSKGYSPVEIAEKINPMPENGRIKISSPEITGQKGDRQDAGTLRHVVFTDLKSGNIRNLIRNMLKQSGYQTESVFRNNETPVNAGGSGICLLKNSRELFLTDTLSALTPELLFDYLGVSLNSEKSKGKKLAFNWIAQNGRSYGFWIENGVLMYREGKPVKHPDAVITGDRLHFALVAMRAMPLKTALDKGMIKIEGNTDKFRELLGCMDKFHENFHVIAP